MNDAQELWRRLLKGIPGGLIILAGCIILGLLAIGLLRDRREQQTAPTPTAAVVAYSVLPPASPTPSPTPTSEATSLPSPQATATATHVASTPEATPSPLDEETPAPQKPASLRPTSTTTARTPVANNEVSAATPTANIPPQPTLTPPVLATPTRIVAAVVREDALTLSTYAYKQALVTTPNFPYPVLDEDKLGLARPETYRAVILENEALQLTFLPELGGRLYQITDKATGQPVLYNNPVIKPTRWGPPEMNWWLAAGGMEWDFPVEEHGYAWAMPWDIVTEAAAGGSAEITLTYQDRVTHLIAEASVVLPPTGQTFSITLTLSNPNDTPTAGQFWTCTAFAAGSGMRMDFPATNVLVHSVGSSEELTGGEVIPWQAEMGAWGRWRDWFSVFAAPVTAGSIDIWGAGNGPGARRSFNPETAPGLKLFTWGTETDTGEFEGSPYFEVWGGLTPDFETFIILAPGEKRQWSESWTVID